LRERAKRAHNQTTIQGWLSRLGMFVNFVGKNGVRFLMILALICNILASTKVFCNAQRGIEWRQGPIPAFTNVSSNSNNATYGALGDNSSLANSGKLPRCSCKKAKSCTPLPPLMLTANLLKRFNEEQRSARSDAVDFGTSFNRSNNYFCMGCRCPAPVIRGKTNALAFHDNVLLLTFVLLI